MSGPILRINVKLLRQIAHLEQQLSVWRFIALIAGISAVYFACALAIKTH